MIFIIPQSTLLVMQGCGVGVKIEVGDPWSRSLSFEGGSDSGPICFFLAFCVILLQFI